MRGKRREISGLLVGELGTEEEVEELRQGGATSPLSVFGSLLVRVRSVTDADVEPKLSPRCEGMGFKVGDADGGGW